MIKKIKCKQNENIILFWVDNTNDFDKLLLKQGFKPYKNKETGFIWYSITDLSLDWKWILL
mgnify:CR=1 FL=1